MIVAVLSITTYVLAARYLVDQRERTAQRQAFVDARIVRDSLLATNDPELALSLLELGPNSSAAIARNSRWVSTSVAAQSTVIPVELRREARLRGSPVHQRYNAVGAPRFTVGVPLPAVHATYFEVAALVELRSTLRVLRNVLIATSVATTLAAILVGIWAGRRVLRPVRDISSVAATIADGDLAARLESRGDPDLDSVVASFNEMADALEQRLERDARFVSDVSHELRSPLTTLATTANLFERRREELPERLQAPVELLMAEIAHFRDVVEEILELSRAESDAEPLALEPVALDELVTHVVRRAGSEVDVQVAPNASGRLVCDKRRLERTLTNLVVNAETHGGGLTRAQVERFDSSVSITLDDEGPGIPPAELGRVFDRFYRGQKSGSRGDSGGAGLGLAIVAEHVRIQRGTVRLENGPDGVGTRAIVEIPWLDA